MNDKIAQAFDRYVAAMQTLQADAVDDFVAMFAEDGEFKDPFNHVHGRRDIRRVTLHMFEVLDDVSFTVRSSGGDGRHRFAAWTFRARQKRIGWFEFDGVSEIELNENGEVVRHIDHWDSTRGLFCKLPLIGGIFRALLSRLSLPERFDPPPA